MWCSTSERAAVGGKLSPRVFFEYKTTGERKKKTFAQFSLTVILCWGWLRPTPTQCCTCTNQPNYPFYERSTRKEWKNHKQKKLFLPKDAMKKPTISFSSSYIPTCASTNLSGGEIAIYRFWFVIMCFYACYCYYFYLARVLCGGVNIHRIVFSWNAYCSLCFKVEVILVTHTRLHTNPLISENKLHLLSFCFWRSQFGFTLAIPLYSSASLMKIESNLFWFNIKSWKCKTKSHRCLRHVPVTLIKSNHKFLTIPVSWNHKLLSFEFSHQKIQTNKLHPTNTFGIHTSLSSSRSPKAEKKMSWPDQCKLWNLPAPQWQHLQTAWLSQEYLHPVQRKRIAPNNNTFIRLPKNQWIIPFFNFPQ